jgi:hypothetical protein
MHNDIENETHIKVLKSLIGLHFEVATMVVPMICVQQALFTTSKYFRISKYLCKEKLYDSDQNNKKFRTSIDCKSNHHGCTQWHGSKLVTYYLATSQILNTKLDCNSTLH